MKAYETYVLLYVKIENEIFINDIKKITITKDYKFAKESLNYNYSKILDLYRLKELQELKITDRLLYNEQAVLKRLELDNSKVFKRKFFTKDDSQIEVICLINEITLDPGYFILSKFIQKEL